MDQSTCITRTKDVTPLLWDIQRHRATTATPHLCSRILATAQHRIYRLTAIHGWRPLQPRMAFLPLIPVRRAVPSLARSARLVLRSLRLQCPPWLPVRVEIAEQEQPQVRSLLPQWPMQFQPYWPLVPAVSRQTLRQPHRPRPLRAPAQISTPAHHSSNGLPRNLPIRTSAPQTN